MKKKSKLLAKTNGVKIRIRIVGPYGDAFGPGKAQIVEKLIETKNLVVAARELKMSYMKAWRLIHAMNKSFRQPLLEKKRGGTDKGATSLTPFGMKVFRTYQRMQEKATEAAYEDWLILKRLLKSRAPVPPTELNESEKSLPSLGNNKFKGE